MLAIALLFIFFGSFSSGQESTFAFVPLMGAVISIYYLWTARIVLTRGVGVVSGIDIANGNIIQYILFWLDFLMYVSNLLLPPWWLILPPDDIRSLIGISLTGGIGLVTHLLNNQSGLNWESPY